ncbi:MAG TPA: hypothetical protein ENF34_02495 [Candidatus Bathyarchaeota archaeon]|nr:hypothetical protein [Candidatus Bathyarchaeota archaeon]
MRGLGSSVEHYAHFILALGLVAWLRPLRGLPWHKKVLWALAANLPDMIDFYVLMPLASWTGLIPSSWPWSHRSFAHTLWFPISTSLLLFLLTRNWRYGASLLALQLLAHLLPDALSSPTPIFMPLIPPIHIYLGQPEHSIKISCFSPGLALVLLRARSPAKPAEKPAHQAR